MFLRHGIHVHVEGKVFMTIWAAEEGLGEEKQEGNVCVVHLGGAGRLGDRVNSNKTH